MTTLPARLRAHDPEAHREVYDAITASRGVLAEVGRLLGPAEHLVRCSRCEAPTIVLCQGEPGAGVLCEGCLMPRQPS